MPLALVMSAGALCFTAIALWAPPTVQNMLLGANGALWTAFAAVVLRRPIDLWRQSAEPAASEAEDKTPTDAPQS